MGAFGRMLIQHFGGDLRAYDNAGSTYITEKPKTKKEIIKENREFDGEKLEQIKISCESLLPKIKHLYSILDGKQDEHLLEVFKTEKGFDNFIKWRKHFLKELLNEEQLNGK